MGLVEGWEEEGKYPRRPAMFPSGSGIFFFNMFFPLWSSPANTHLLGGQDGAGAHIDHSPLAFSSSYMGCSQSVEVE